MATLTTTPKLDAEIQRLQARRQADGLPLLPRHKAIAQLSAERICAYFADHNIEHRPSDVDMVAWLILDPVIETP